MALTSAALLLILRLTVALSLGIESPLDYWGLSASAAETGNP